MHMHMTYRAYPAPVRAFMAIVGLLFGLLRRVGIKRGLARTHLWHDVREVLRERVEARDSDPMP